LRCFSSSLSQALVPKSSQAASGLSVNASSILQNGCSGHILAKLIVVTVHSLIAESTWSPLFCLGPRAPLSSLATPGVPIDPSFFLCHCCQFTFCFFKTVVIQMVSLHQRQFKCCHTKHTKGQY
jgi:hypothetical protein